MITKIDRNDFADTPRIACNRGTYIEEDFFYAAPYTITTAEYGKDVARLPGPQATQRGFMGNETLHTNGNNWYLFAKETESINYVWSISFVVYGTVGSRFTTKTEW